MIHRASHRGKGLARSANRLLRRAIGIESLEQRCLFTIDNPLIVSVAALPIEGIAFGTNSPLIATFASPAPIGNLSATVAFPSGTTTSNVISTGGTETVDGTNVPEFQVNYTGNWTPPDESPGVPFTVTITDSTGGTGNTTVLHGATAVRDGVLTSNGGIVATVTEGASVSFTGGSSLMTFTDANPISSTSDFSATINWGDGSAESFGVISQPGGAGTAFSISGTHAYLDEGQYTATVKVADKGGSSAFQTSTITVNDADLSDGAGTTLGGTEGQNLNNVLVGTFTDANPLGDPTDFSAKINWGDGSADAGAVSVIGGNSSGVIFGIYGNHTYTDDSTIPFNVTVNVADKGGSSLPTIDSTATIIDPLLIMAGGYKVTAVEGTSTGTKAVATFVDPGGNGPPSEYSATIDWGDGKTTAGTITFGGGFYSVRGPHTYATARSTPYVITTTITHVAGIPQSVISSALITKAPLKGSAVTFSGFEGRSSFVKVAGFTAATATSAADFTASVDWGDGKSTAGSIVKDSAGKYHVTGSHAYAEEGAYTVKVTIHQSGGATLHVNSKANVADSPLDQAAGVSISAVKNSTFSNKKLGTFRDQDALNKLAGDYAGTIDWGDGTTSAAAFAFTSATSNVGSFWKVTGGHKYTTAKTFTVKITIDDSGSPGKKITITTTIKVV